MLSISNFLLSIKKDMMVKKKTHILLSALMLSSFMVQIFGKSHSEAYHQFYKAKLNPNSNIDKSHYFKAPPQPPKPKDQRGLKENDRIHKLPGQPPGPVGFKQYGGYITIDDSVGRAFYYYFAEAQNPKKDHHMPLLLWLNGGPGCSSLGYGAMQEIGPFRIASDGKTLYKNKFAWNFVANVLFLESPAGVGFSYSNITADFKKNNGDRRTAQENYIFLLNWLERFPEYKNRDFYIAGESYAGHYVPQLAHNIVYHNQKANRTIIKLKGILIGNAVINDETDSIGMYDFLATHALISLEASRKVHKYCDFSPHVTISDECDTVLTEIDYSIGNIDQYNIYYPLCSNANLTTFPKHNSILEFDPCSDGYTTAYFNRPDVQEAMHANVTKLDYDWQPCSEVIEHWRDSPSTVIPLLKDLMANNIRVWIYSGDVDGILPVTGTQYSLEAMNIPTLTPWGAWYQDEEVGGYVQEYKDNLAFVTIKGAGHEVPSYKPDRSLSLISHFLTKTPLPWK